MPMRSLMPTRPTSLPRLLLLVSLTLAGCTAGENAPPPEPDTPPPTESGQEAVVKVPGMTCESCAEKVTMALAAFPWIDPASIVIDRKARQARFVVSDPVRFDFEAIRAKVEEAGYAGAQLLAAPRRTAPTTTP